jgi:hypothetical protein
MTDAADAAREARPPLDELGTEEKKADARVDGVPKLRDGDLPRLLSVVVRDGR